MILFPCRPSTRPRAFAALLALTVAAAALSSCGAKGPILPPISLVPKATTDLAVRQQGNDIVLHASYPKTTISGVAMPGVEAIEIYQYVRPLPPAVAATAAPSATVTATPDAAAAPAAPATPTAPATATAPTPATAATSPIVPTVPTAPDPREFALAAKKMLTLRGAELAGVVTGEDLEMRVPLPQPLPAERQAWTLAIRVIAKGDHRSDLSNQVTLAPVPPPAPPSGLAVVAKENGIEVSWTAVEPPLIGVLIYRREAQVPSWGDFLHGSRIAEGASYLDTTAQYGHRYVFSISAAAALAPRIESALAGEQEVDYQDRFAPAPPAHLIALAEARRVRLVWERSPSADVAGYVVFRQDPGGEFHRLNEEPTAELEWNDAGLVPRIAYVYRVAAIDKAGNLGEPGESVGGSPTGR